MGLTRKVKKTIWGYHLVVDAGLCDPEALRSKSKIADFAKTLVESINMKAYGMPKIVMFGSGNKKGYTLVQLIETSNITAHFVEESNDIYLDIFSCKEFDKNIALSIFKKYFKPKYINYKFITRRAPRD